MSISKNVNDFIAENYDRLHIIVPQGTKTALRGRFTEGMTLNKYINCLIELDLRGKIDWGDFDEDCRLLRKMAETSSAVSGADHIRELRKGSTELPKPRIW